MSSVHNNNNNKEEERKKQRIQSLLLSLLRLYIIGYMSLECYVYKGNVQVCVWMFVVLRSPTLHRSLIAKKKEKTKTKQRSDKLIDNVFYTYIMPYLQLVYIWLCITLHYRFNSGTNKKIIQTYYESYKIITENNTQNIAYTEAS